MRRMNSLLSRMPRLALGLLIGGLALSAAANGAAAATQLVRVPAKAPGLEDLGLALDHVVHDGPDVLVVVSDDDRSALQQAAIPYVTVIEDMEKYYENRLLGE